MADLTGNRQAVIWVRTGSIVAVTPIRVRLDFLAGTAVAMAFPRSPTSTAITAWSLQKLSGGRFTLGLGSQVKGHIERRYGLAWSPAGGHDRSGDSR